MIFPKPRRQVHPVLHPALGEVQSAPAAQSGRKKQSSRAIFHAPRIDPRGTTNGHPLECSGKACRGPPCSSATPSLHGPHHRGNNASAHEAPGTRREQPWWPIQTRHSMSSSPFVFRPDSPRVPGLKSSRSVPQPKRPLRRPNRSHASRAIGFHGPSRQGQSTHRPPKPPPTTHHARATQDKSPRAQTKHFPSPQAPASTGRERRIDAEARESAEPTPSSPAGRLVQVGRIPTALRLHRDHVVAVVHLSLLGQLVHPLSGPRRAGVAAYVGQHTDKHTDTGYGNGSPSQA